MLNHALRGTRRGRASTWRFGAAIFLLLATFSISSFAGVIYEYREEGSPTVIGTLELAPSGPIAVFLDDAVFGLGSANLLSVAGTLTLDGADIYISFPTIFPIVPTDPTIDQILVILFDPSSGGDIIEVATQSRFPDGSIRISDQFTNGNWVAQVAEPGTLILLWVGLLGIWLEGRAKASLSPILFPRTSRPRESSPNDAREGASGAAVAGGP
jgi:hypothetical protein